MVSAAREAEANIVLRWTCETCGWQVDVPAPGYAGDGYRHYFGDLRGCGPLVARRVGGFLRLPPGVSTAETEAAVRGAA
jgi:hypothetical protein